MMRILLVTLLLACAAGAAQAQLRSIPEDAKRATMSHVQGMIVELNGKRTQLAAGAQIRDASNRIVLPTALPAESLVRFTTDMQGQVWRIWILSPQEAAQPDPKK
jgi:nitrous oxide reductase accessory protein NosL